MEKKLEEARSVISQRAQLQTRLQTVFSAINGPCYTKSCGKETTPSLIIHYHNGIDPIPQFSGSVIARLFLDNKGNLSLASWPLEKEKNLEWRKEILLTNVKDYEFEFLTTTNASEHGKKEKVRPITPNLCWKSQLSKTSSFSIIRLTLHEKNKETPTQFAFILPTPTPIVSYKAGAA